MKIQFTDEAEADLEAIADYIASDSPTRAISFVRELREKALSLASLPLAFPLVPRFERHGVRRRIYGNYGIFYIVRGEVVTVISMTVAKAVEIFDKGSIFSSADQPIRAST